jgi:hypothetical protein
VLGDGGAITVFGAVFEDLLGEDLPDGRNLADDYQGRRGWKEGVGTRDDIAALRRTPMSLFEVSGAVPGESLMLRDMVRGAAGCRVGADDAGVQSAAATHSRAGSSTSAARPTAGTLGPESRDVAALSQLRNAQLDGARAGLPVALAVALALVDPAIATLAMASAGQATYLQLHQPLRGEADHLAE